MGSRAAGLICLVTGAGGFLGGALAARLTQRGTVRSFQRQYYPELEAMGVAQHQGDLVDAEAVMRAVDGVDIVYHVAALASVWGPKRSFVETNYVGTENILDACRAHGVSRLVYTSTPSVVHGGSSLEGVDSSAPYPETFLAYYPETKARAEKAVLAANGKSLATVALRPHLIWGPGDRHLVPRIFDRARKGRLRLVGSGEQLVDTVYIDNAVDAHIKAGQLLGFDSPIAGRAYFVTNDEPRPIRDIINSMLKAGSLPPCNRHVSPTVAYVAGAVSEFVYGMFRIQSEPMMTRFVAKQLATSHYYNIEDTKRDLQYTPRVTLDEGFRRLTEALNTV